MSPRKATSGRPTLSDPEYARFAWRRYRRMMRWVALAAAVTVVVALVWLRAEAGPMPIHMIIATIAGVGFSVLLAGALMGLAFLSSGTGHDEDAADFAHYDANGDDEND